MEFLSQAVFELLGSQGIEATSLTFQGRATLGYVSIGFPIGHFLLVGPLEPSFYF